jgi:inner membrane organizing system protein 1
LNLNKVSFGTPSQLLQISIVIFLFFLPNQMLESDQSSKILSTKFDKTVSELIVNTSVGLTVGICASFLLFKRKTWPIALTTGFGIGLTYGESLKTFKL